MLKTRRIVCEKWDLGLIVEKSIFSFFSFWPKTRLFTEKHLLILWYLESAHRNTSIGMRKVRSLKECDFIYFSVFDPKSKKKEWHWIADIRGNIDVTYFSGVFILFIRTHWSSKIGQVSNISHHCKILLIYAMKKVKVGGKKPIIVEHGLNEWRYDRTVIRNNWNYWDRSGFGVAWTVREPKFLDRLYRFGVTNKECAWESQQNLGHQSIQQEKLAILLFKSSLLK